MPKHKKKLVLTDRVSSIIAYSIFALFIFAAILQISTIYGPFGGTTYVRQSFRPSPASAWLGIGDFYPNTSLEKSSGLFDNYQQRIIKNEAFFLMLHLPNKNKADMKLAIKNTSSPTSAMISITDNTGDTYFRIIGKDKFHARLLQSDQYTTLYDPQTNILLFQRMGEKTQFKSINDFFTNSPKTPVGLYYAPTDQLRFTDAQELNTKVLTDTSELSTLKLSELPDYILSSQATVLSQNALHTSYGVNWNLEKIPTPNYAHYTFNLMPHNSHSITIKPIIVKLY